MRALLFRRIVVDGINYYQLFKDDLYFRQTETFGDYYNRDSYDYFYIDKDSDITVPDESYLNIYYDDGNRLKSVDDFELYDKVSRALNDKFHYFSGEKKVPEDIIKNVKKEVLFQDECVKELVEQLYLNQTIVCSNLPIELKMSQKNNILFHGRVGSGKNKIINEIEKNIDIPYSDIVIDQDNKDTLEAIIKGLFDKAKREEDASHGIVFIHDTYIGSKIYEAIKFLNSQGLIDYNGKLIDFRTITFVILLDEYDNTNIEDIQKFQDMINCTCRISTRDLSLQDKYVFLFSKKGRLRQYMEFFKQQGKKLTVDPETLVEIINRCASLNPSMEVLNSMIDVIIKYSIKRKINDVHIDKKLLNEIMSIFDINTPEIEQKEEKDKYWFERKVDKIVEKTKEFVVGQDDSVRLLAYQLLNNICNANKEDKENPKDYINNILIRGNTGTGKSFILGTVLKQFDVPYHIVDATKYTEAGYAGEDVENMLIGLIRAAGGDIEKAQRGILAIDEIDKRASIAGEREHDIGGGVQEALYKLAEGSKITVNLGDHVNKNLVSFDTSRLTVICAGAFENIEEIRDSRLGLKNMGFERRKAEEQKLELIDKDYINYGMKAQFMRRLMQIVELKDYDKERLIDIMKESKSSALKVQQEDLLENQGIELEYTDDFYEAIAEEALLMKEGVSGIKKTLIKVLNGIGNYNIRASETSKIILSGETVHDPTKVILVPRGKRKTKKM